MSLDSLKALVKDLGLSQRSPRECCGPGEGETLVGLKIELAAFLLQIRVLWFLKLCALLQSAVWALSTRVAEYQRQVSGAGFHLQGGGIRLRFSTSRSRWPNFDVIKVDTSHQLWGLHGQQFLPCRPADVWSVLWRSLSSR